MLLKLQLCCIAQSLPLVSRPGSSAYKEATETILPGSHSKPDMIKLSNRFVQICDPLCSKCHPYKCLRWHWNTRTLPRGV